MVGAVARDGSALGSLANNVENTDRGRAWRPDRGAAPNGDAKLLAPDWVRPWLGPILVRSIVLFAAGRPTNVIPPGPSAGANSS